MIFGWLFIQGMGISLSNLLKHVLLLLLFSTYVLLQRDKTDEILSAFVAGGQSEPASTSKVHLDRAGTGAEQLS